MELHAALELPDHAPSSAGATVERWPDTIQAPRSGGATYATDIRSELDIMVMVTQQRVRSEDGVSPQKIPGWQP